MTKAAGIASMGELDGLEAGRLCREILRGIEQLRRSEERYRLAACATNDAIWDFDVVTDEVEWGGSAHDILGYGMSKIAGGSRWWRERVHPDDLPASLAVIDAAIESGSAQWAVEYRFRRADGTYADILDRGYLICGRDGAVLRMVGAMLDLTERKTAEAKAQELAQRLASVLESTSDSVCTIDRDWRFVYLNERARQELGQGRDLVGQDIFEVFPGLAEREIGKAIVEAVRTGSPRRLKAHSASLGAWLDNHLFPSPEGLTIFFRNVTEEHVAEEARRLSENRLRLALSAGKVVVWEQDLATGVTTRSENSAEVLGIGSGQASDFWDRVHPEDLMRARMMLYGSSKHVEKAEFRFIRDDGKVIWISESALRVEDGGSERILGTLVDITERKEAEERVWHAAHHDPLTGLPNRALFQMRLEQALADAARREEGAAVLLLDIDNFKDVNDTLGHDAGDALLRAVAARLGAVEAHTVARWAGDEFVLILQGPTASSRAAGLADSVLEALREPIGYGDRAIGLRASIGIALFPEHDRDAVDLMKDADIALYAAKGQGRNRAAIYSPGMRASMEERVALARDMRDALAAGQIVPFYQPKVNLSTGKVIGFEALARWRHPEKGLLAPGAFASAFEDPDLAVAIGQAMIEQVLQDLGGWLLAGLDCGPVAVNLSTAECTQADLADRILSRLRKAGLSASSFEVEVTESVFLGRSLDQVTENLKRLHEGGIRIALDDFGTGYASLSHLKQFPVDTIKIDQSFIRGVEEDANDEAIVSAVIGLGKSLKLQVVAEGVETSGQAHRLLMKGCDVAQGYVYARPMCGSRVPMFLDDWNAKSLGAGPARHGLTAA